MDLSGKTLDLKMDGSYIDELYLSLEDEDDLQDAKSEVRQGEYETDISPDWSRNYESNSVAAKLPDGSWVGWTYWYGGGKHGEPEAMSWMEDAYELSCVEQEKLVIVRNFTKI